MGRIEAVVYHGPGDVRVQTVPRPLCRDGQLLVRVEACAVCGSDLKAWRHGNPRIDPPRVMGHEFTGVIEQVGPGAGPWQVGQRVVMATSVSCGRCAYCRRRWPHLCEHLAPMGFACDGGMAGYVVIPAQAVARGHVVEVPAHVDAAVAALAEPLSCAVHCCRLCGIRPGQRVLVMGAGPMGILIGCVARQMGAGQVFVTEPHPPRRRQAGTFGFDAVLDGQEVELAEWLADRTEGRGVDVAIVAAPAAAPQAQAPQLVRKRGVVCWFASLPAGHSQVSLDSRVVHYGERRIIGSSDSTPQDVRQAVALLAEAAVPADRLVSHQLPLSGVLEAFALMQSGQALRVVLRP